MLPDSHPTITLLVQIGQLVTYLFGAIAAIVAVVGLNTWRRQLVEGQRIKLASEALEHFYIARDALKAVRSGAAFANEFEEIARLPDETKRQYDARSVLALVLLRFDKTSGTFSKIEALRYQFMAAFGQSSTQPFDLLRRATSELIAAVHTCMQLERYVVSNDEVGVAVPDGLYQQVKDMHEKIWGAITGQPPDTITKGVNDAVSEIEKLCLPVINPPSRFDRFKAASRRVLSTAKRRLLFWRP